MNTEIESELVFFSFVLSFFQRFFLVEKKDESESEKLCGLYCIVYVSCIVLFT